MNKTVCTFYELLHGDNTRSEGKLTISAFDSSEPNGNHGKRFVRLEFYNLDPQLFRRILSELEKRGQATVFSDNGADGVKFS